MLHRNKFDIILSILQIWKRYFYRTTSKIMASVDAVNASTAQLSWAYLNGVLRDYNAILLTENMKSTPMEPIPRFRSQSTGIMKCLTTNTICCRNSRNTCNCNWISSCRSNMVREKEVGTIEQINVTPVRNTSYHCKNGSFPYYRDD